MSLARPNTLSRPKLPSRLAALTAAAMLCVPPVTFADGPTPGHSTLKNESAAARFASQAVDVKLSSGAVRGRMVTDTGAPIANADVSAHKPGVEAALVKTKTDAEGKFALVGVPAGECVVNTSKGAQTVRVWNETAAPPKALSEIALVSVDPAVRGQYGLFCDPALNLAMGIATAGVILSAITLGEIDDLQDDNAALRRELSDDDDDDAVSP